MVINDQLSVTYNQQVNRHQNNILKYHPDAIYYIMKIIDKIPSFPNIDDPSIAYEITNINDQDIWLKDYIYILKKLEILPEFN